MMKQNQVVCLCNYQLHLTCWSMKEEHEDHKVASYGEIQTDLRKVKLLPGEGCQLVQLDILSYCSLLITWQSLSSKPLFITVSVISLHSGSSG